MLLFVVFVNFMIFLLITPLIHLNENDKVIDSLWMLSLLLIISSLIYYLVTNNFGESLILMIYSLMALLLNVIFLIKDINNKKGK